MAIKEIESVPLYFNTSTQLCSSKMPSCICKSLEAIVQEHLGEHVSEGDVSRTIGEKDSIRSDAFANAMMMYIIVL